MFRISQKESVLPCVSVVAHILKLTNILKYFNALELNELEASVLGFDKKSLYSYSRYTLVYVLDKILSKLEILQSFLW